MPTVAMYIRAEYAELWQSIPNKSQFIADTLRRYQIEQRNSQRKNTEPSQRKAAEGEQD